MVKGYTCNSAVTIRPILFLMKAFNKKMSETCVLIEILRNIFLKPEVFLGNQYMRMKLACHMSLNIIYEIFILFRIFIIHFLWRLTKCFIL